MDNLFIIDDDKHICVTLSLALDKLYSIRWSQDAQEGLAMIKEEPPDLVLLDLRIGRHNGIEVLKQILEIYPSLPVIIMTGYSSIKSSVEALKAGAFHYIAKPIEMDELRNLIAKALEHIHLQNQVKDLNCRLNAQKVQAAIIGNSPVIKDLLKLIDKIKDINTTVLITGESGTGKEIIARTIHYSSNRSNGPFEAVNCSAIPIPLLESEFFGHKKGSFTGADSSRKGKFEICSGGTLFLDEIGDMDINVQAKLLRVLQEKEISPVGSNEKIQVDVRLIAATNKDLKKAMEEGAFREDLYYRLSVITLHSPALRQRREDIPLLIQHFLNKYNAEFNKDVRGIEGAALRAIEQSPLRGNVRELENLIVRGIALAEGSLIRFSDLPSLSQEMATNLSRELAGCRLADIEKQTIMETLAFTGNNRTKAAQLLGITDRTLRNKLEQYRLQG
ncbi:MAG: sigma-54 dependent transcriptional regulator [Clostridiales bacterium]